MFKSLDTFMGKKLEDLIVTLPFEDGSVIDFGVYAYFEVDDIAYFALLPFKEEKVLDFSQSYQLYRVEMDAEDNPNILYIESDYEYAVAATYFSSNYLDNQKN